MCDGRNGRGIIGGIKFYASIRIWTPLISKSFDLNWQHQSKGHNGKSQRPIFLLNSYESKPQFVVSHLKIVHESNQNLRREESDDIINESRNLRNSYKE